MWLFLINCYSMVSFNNTWIFLQLLGKIESSISLLNKIEKSIKMKIFLIQTPFGSVVTVIFIFSNLSYTVPKLWINRAAVIWIWKKFTCISSSTFTFYSCSLQDTFSTKLCIKSFTKIWASHITKQSPYFIESLASNVPFVWIFHPATYNKFSS